MQQGNKIFLEVIANTPADCLTIESNGGDRIELVSALEIGGLTPSPVIIRKSMEAVSIPIHVIVRHHNNGFVHTPTEIELLLEEVIELKDKFNVHGVVIGGLEQKQDSLLVHKLFVDQVIRECGGKTNFTFHKASDFTPSIKETVDMLSEAGVNEILTQGGTENLLHPSNIKSILSIEPTRRKQMILAGGGVNHENVRDLVKEWEINRVHIGTCVRSPKYGPVSSESLQEFRKIIDSL